MEIMFIKLKEQQEKLKRNCSQKLMRHSTFSEHRGRNLDFPTSLEIFNINPRKKSGFDAHNYF